MTTTTSDSDAIIVSEQTLLRDGTPMRLYSGEINYWRIERADWERVLNSLVDTHATAVTLYIPRRPAPSVASDRHYSRLDGRPPTLRGATTDGRRASET